MTPITTGEKLVIRTSDTTTRRKALESVTNVDSTVVEVGSTGLPAVEPLVTVTQGGQTAFHVQCSPKRVRTIVPNVEQISEGVADETLSEGKLFEIAQSIGDKRLRS